MLAGGESTLSRWTKYAAHVKKLPEACSAINYPVTGPMGGRLERSIISLLVAE
jgi:hypothetical protein